MSKKKLIVGIVLAVLLLISVLFNVMRNEDSEFNLDEPIPTQSTPTTTKNNTKIYVEIKGQVLNPGVYEMNEGSRVFELIDLAGGLLEDADLGYVNQTKILNDEFVLIIRSKDEITLNQSDIEIDEEIVYDTKDFEVNSTNQLININKASKNDFESLPGIGPSKAQNIVDYRNEHGLFSSINDLLNVLGIGEGTLEKIKKYITL